MTTEPTRAERIAALEARIEENYQRWRIVWEQSDDVLIDTEIVDEELDDLEDELDALMEEQ